jgi:hypothetical protein
MKLNGILWFSAVLLFILILLAGCNWNLCTVNIPYDPPMVTDPNNYAEPGLVTFNWYYRYPLWCNTDYFALSVWESNDVYDINNPNPDAITVSTRDKSIEYPTPLEPGKFYVWSLYHARKSITGPDIQGRHGTGYFSTGPYCSSLDELNPVDLIYPENEQVVTDDVYGNYLWQDPNHCYLGNGGAYHFQIGMDPGFVDPIIDSPNSTAHDIEVNIGFDHEVCEAYYWRVITENENEGINLISATNRFYFYPQYSILPVTLLSPVDHAFIPAEELNFDWEEPSACNRVFMYEIQVSEQEDFSSFSYQMNSRTLDPVTLERPKPDLEACTQYYWRIMTDPPGDSENIYSEIRRFVLSDPQGPCPIEIPQFTPLPNDYRIVTTTPTANPLMPSVTALENLNCRAGPGSVYKIDDTLMAGKTAPVEGRNDLSTWWYIFLENHKRHCWVWGAKAEFIGDVNQVPILDTPPTPIPDKPVCSAFMDEKTCKLYPACQWVTKVSTTPYCTVK